VKYGSVARADADVFMKFPKAVRPASRNPFYASSVHLGTPTVIPQCPLSTTQYPFVALSVPPLYPLGTGQYPLSTHSVPTL
jgi:hypothetical protein